MSIPCQKAFLLCNSYAPRISASLDWSFCPKCGDGGSLTKAGSRKDFSCRGEAQRRRKPRVTRMGTDLFAAKRRRRRKDFCLSRRSERKRKLLMDGDDVGQRVPPVSGEGEIRWGERPREPNSNSFQPQKNAKVAKIFSRRDEAWRRRKPLMNGYVVRQVLFY